MSVPCALFTSCSPSLTAREVIRRKYAHDWQRVWLWLFTSLPTGQSRLQVFSIGTVAAYSAKYSALVATVNWRHIHWPSFGKGEKTEEVHCCDIVVLIILFWCFWCVNDYKVESVYWNIVWWGCESILINWHLFSPLPKLGQLTSIDRENCCDILVLIVLFWCFWCVKD